MVYLSHVPQKPLSNVVENIVFYEGYTPTHTVDRFLPDGQCEIIIDLTDTPKYVYDNDTLLPTRSFKNMWISGVRTSYITIPSGRDSRMIIIAFRRGHARSILGLPMVELADTIVEADLLLGASATELRDELLNTSEPTDMFAIVERFLLRRHRAFAAHERTANCMEVAMQKIVRQPQAGSLQSLIHTLGYTQKHIATLFNNHVGVTPKRYMRIMRFQHVVAAMDSRRELPWTDIALEAGYYDQAHFINDFKSFSGFTPSLYDARAYEYLNYIPVG